MKTTNEKLDELFSKWREDKNMFPYFTKDGLVYKHDANIDIEKAWNESPRRIAFLLRDQHQQGGLWDEDIREWLRGEGSNYEKNRNLKGKFIRNIANLFYGLNNLSRQNKCELQSIPEEVIKCHFNTAPFALVECKKVPGGSSLNPKTLRDYLNHDSNYLRQELEILNPNIIVCTSGDIRNMVLSWYSKEDVIDFPTFNSVHFNKKTKKLIFNSYHPSAIKSPVNFYEGVMWHYREGFMKSEYATEPFI